MQGQILEVLPALSWKIPFDFDLDCGYVKHLLETPPKQLDNQSISSKQIGQNILQIYWSMKIH